MQRPLSLGGGHDEVSNEDYFPLVDSFSDICEQDEAEFVADFHQLNDHTRQTPELASARPQIAEQPEMETVLFPEPVADAAFYPQAVADATFYPQAHAVVRPTTMQTQVPAAGSRHLVGQSSRGIVYPRPQVTPATISHDRHHHPHHHSKPSPSQLGCGRYPISGIEFPGPNDVMFGRGGGTNQHVGNIRFRQLVAKHKAEYANATRGEKPKIAAIVVQAWRTDQDPPGRFLTKSDPSMGDDSYWHDVGEKEAKKKASQCLREKTADVAPAVLAKPEQTEDSNIDVVTERSPNSRPKIHQEDSNDKDTMKMRTTNPLMVSEPLVVDVYGFQQQTSAKYNVHGRSRGRVEYVNASRNGATAASVIDASSPSFDATSSSGTAPATSSSSSPSPKSNSPSVSIATHSASSARVGPRLSLVKEKKIRNIREEISDWIPNAADLAADAFDDVDEDEQNESDDSVSALPPELLELMEASSIGNLTDGMESVSTNPSTATMESLSTSSWLRTFQSLQETPERAVPSSNSNRTMMSTNSNRTMMSTNSNRTMMSMNTATSSLRRIVEERILDDADESIDALDLAFPADQESENRTANLQKLKSARSQVSGFSLMSDLTGDSSTQQHRRTMHGARRDSGYSISTEVSHGLKSMDLAL